MITFPVPVESDDIMVRGVRQGEWTAAHWERLPDDGSRYEIIDGVLYMATAPSAFHQWAGLSLYENFGIPAKQRKLGFTYLAPIGVFMPNIEPVQPDFVFVRAANVGIIRDRRIYGIPDVIIEILSPNSRLYDLEIKKDAYEKAGVPEYGVVDLAARSVIVFTLDSAGRYDQPRVFQAAETLAFSAIPGVSVQVSALFEGSPDTTL